MWLYDLELKSQQIRVLKINLRGLVLYISHSLFDYDNVSFPFMVDYLSGLIWWVKRRI